MNNSKTLATTRRTALCLDDNEQVRPLVGLTLRKAGFAVTEVATCAEARRALQNGIYTLAVLDVDLPDGNGFDLAKEWRRDGHGSLPILFVSGREHSACQKKATQLNARFLPKPFGPLALLAAVNLLLF